MKDPQSCINWDGNAEGCNCPECQGESDTISLDDDSHDDDSCIRDDSTECDCSRCTGAEDRFWQEQGDRKPGESVESEPELKCCPRFTWGDGTHDLGCRGAQP